MRKLALHWWILIGMAAGVLAGWAVFASYPEEAVPGTAWYEAFDGLATIFLNLLKLIVVPLVFFSLLSGLLAMGDVVRLGRLGVRTLLYYLTTSLLAIVAGLVLVNLIGPGRGFTIDMPLEAVAYEKPDSFWDVLITMVPSNVVEAAAKMDLFGVILFTLLFGAFLLTLSGPKRETMVSFVEAGNEIMMKMTGFVLSLAPVGIGALIARLISTIGPDKIKLLAPYFLTVLATLGFHLLITLPLLIWLRTRRNPYRFLLAMFPALITGFSTASSSGTLSVTMDRAERGAGVSNRVASFVLPIGATVNMDGTALYEIVTVLFIAQMHAGLDPNFTLTFGQQLLIVFLGLAVSIGAAGIPHAGLVMMVIILEAVGLPVEYTGLIWVVDRPLDMARTAVNISGDASVSYMIAHDEGEIDPSVLGAA